jgi:hypothetical protein
MTVFSRIGEISARALPVALIGLPALGALIFLTILVIGSDARTERVSRVLLAWRGNVGCLAPRGTTGPVHPEPQPRRS